MGGPLFLTLDRSIVIKKKKFISFLFGLVNENLTFNISVYIPAMLHNYCVDIVRHILNFLFKD